MSPVNLGVTHLSNQLCLCIGSLSVVAMYIDHIGQGRDYIKGRIRWKRMLTRNMASFTRSFLMRPALNRFSINSVLDEPEQYHAMDMALFAIRFTLRFAPVTLSLKFGCRGSFSWAVIWSPLVYSRYDTYYSTGW